MKHFLFTCGLLLLFLGKAYSQRGFAIVIDPKSYEEARVEVKGYADAIEAMQKLKVYTVIDRWGVPDSIHAELMRLHRQKTHPVEGAVFIGDIPVAMIRDAQHLTSAFKMDQRRDRKASSVPSDRYYDDFGLRFTSLGKDEDAPYYYYSLNADSRQFLNPDLYTGRIRPTDCNGTSRYEKLRAYLKKVTAEKLHPEKIEQMLYFSGHGYISESMVARIDEKEAIYEHFPWLKRQQNGIGYIDHNQEDVIKYRLMNELMRPELDYAVLHHHGYWDTQYLSDIPMPKNVWQAKQLIQSYGRKHLRSAKEKGTGVDSMMAKLQKAFDAPSTWWNDAFDPKVSRQDSIAEADLDLHLADFQAHGYRPNCRVVMIDACFCGSFHKEDCIANEYIFNPGRTVACIANTVNVLQDKWSDRYMGLLGIGACVGEVARYSGYLESHVIGDPTFTFVPSVENAAIGELLASDRASQWKKLLKPETLPDLQCVAMDHLQRAGLLTPERILEIFKTSPHAIVRIQALVSLADLRGDAFIEAIRLGVDDSHEMVQRFALRYLGQSGDERLIPSLMKVCISNNTSKRCNFNALNALSFYPEEKLLAAFRQQFHKDDVRYIDKEKIGQTIEKAIRSSAKKWIEDVDSVTAKSTSDKVRRRSIRTLRNYCPHYLIPQLLEYVESCRQPEMQVLLLEALGWHRYSYMAPRIADCARKMSQDVSLPAEVRNEALKTYNRTK